MSSWKSVSNDLEETEARRESGVARKTHADVPPPRQVQVTSLEIEIAPDADCDPYNRTGQFCVPTFNKYEKD